MINFIIYDNNREMVNLYKDIINNFMGSRNSNYRLYEFYKYDKDVRRKIKEQFIGKNIYILNMDVSKVNGLDFAKMVRDNNDWASQIIVITSCDKYNNSCCFSKSLRLDFISKFVNIEKELFFSLDISIKNLNRYATLSFKYDGEVYQIMYRDIYYIEKNLNNNDSTIVTRDNKYIIKYSISKLMDILNDDPRFFKCHRSCIVNLDNIVSLDMEHNIIRFKNREISLLSRNRKKELKNRLMVKNYVSES